MKLIFSPIIACALVLSIFSTGCFFDPDPLLARQCNRDLDCEDPRQVCLEGYCSTSESQTSCLDDPSLCDNGQFCDGVEACAPGNADADSFGCVAGDPVDTDDGVACTIGRCDESTDVVIQDCSECACCGNANPCFAQTPPACSTWVCSPVFECEMVAVEAEAACDDGLDCTSGDACDAEGVCSGTPNDGLCDDAAFCNGVESCNPDAQGADESGCVSGTPPDLDDGIGCTVDLCDEDNDTIVHDQTPCVCERDDDCEGPCQTGTCEDGACVFVPGEEGEPCDDGIACTRSDACDGSQRCVGIPSNAECDDEAFCNGDELCSPGAEGADEAGCVEGTPPVIDDGVECTVDSCSDRAGEVRHDASSCECEVDGDCETGLCEVARCEGFACVVEVAPEGTGCDDGVACTANDVCDLGGACAGSPDDTFCADEDVCNGIELCEPDVEGADGQGCRVERQDPLPLECQTGPDEIGGLSLWLDAANTDSVELTVERQSHNLRGDFGLFGGDLPIARSEDADPLPGNYYVYSVAFQGVYNGPLTVVLDSDTADNSHGDTFSVEVRNPSAQGFELYVYRTDDEGNRFGKGPDLVGWQTEEALLVSSWDDLSGNRDALQEAQDRRPVYVAGVLGGLPILRFRDDFMDFDRPARDNMTIAVVFRTTDAGGGSNWYNSPAIVGGELSGAIDDLGLVLNNGRVGWGARDSNFEVLSDTEGQYSDGQGHAVVLTRSRMSGAVVLRVDGVERDTGTGVTNRLDDNPFLRLARHPTGSGRFDADYAEVIIYNRALNAEDTAILETYLLNKWRL